MLQMRDFYQDNGALFGRLFNSAEDVPDILKRAEYPTDRSEIEGMADNAFADPANKTFLIHDAANTCVSHIYLKSAGAEDSDPRMARVQKAASLFGIEGEIHRLTDLIISRKQAEAEENQKTASDNDKVDESWSVHVVHDGKLVEQSGYGKQAFLTACDGVLDNSMVIQHPAAFVQKVAQAFTDEALRIGGEVYEAVPDELFKLAGHGYPDPDELQACISARAIALPLDERAGFIQKAAQLHDATDKGVDGLRKLAEALDRIDRSNNLQKFYGKKFPDPLRTVHSISTRKTASLLRKVKIGNSSYYAEQLNDPGVQKIAAHVLGEDTYVQAFGETGFCPRKLASTIPAALEVAFNRLVQNAGVPATVSA